MKSHWLTGGRLTSTQNGNRRPIDTTVTGLTTNQLGIVFFASLILLALVLHAIGFIDLGILFTRPSWM